MPLQHNTATPRPTERLEQARRRVSFALSEIASDSAPDFVTLDEIARSPVLALRELEALQLTLAVTERRRSA